MNLLIRFKINPRWMVARGKERFAERNSRRDAREKRALCSGFGVMRKKSGGEKEIGKKIQIKWKKIR